MVGTSPGEAANQEKTQEVSFAGSLLFWESDNCLSVLKFPFCGSLTLLSLTVFVLILCLFLAVVSSNTAVML